MSRELSIQFNDRLINFIAHEITHCARDHTSIIVTTVEVDTSLEANCPIDPHNPLLGRHVSVHHSGNDKVPLLGAIGSHRPVKSILKYASLSMRIEGAWSTTPFTYLPSSGVRERSTWCPYRPPGDGIPSWEHSFRT